MWGAAGEIEIGFSGAIIVDRFGNQYISGAITPVGFGITPITYGEGYVFKGNVSHGFGRNLLLEHDLQEVINGVAASISFQEIVGATISLSSPDWLGNYAYAMEIFLLGTGQNAGLLLV